MGIVECHYIRIGLGSFLPDLPEGLGVAVVKDLVFTHYLTPNYGCTIQFLLWLTQSWHTL